MTYILLLWKGVTGMIDFTLRNLSLFFRDRTAVVFSVLGEVIIVLLYILFMREDLLGSFSSVEDADLLIDLWMAAGIMGVTSVTSSMGIYGIMIDDRSSGILKDLCTAPVRRSSLICGYLLSSAFTGVILMTVTLMAAEIYFLSEYGVMAGGENMMQIYGLIVLTAISSSAMVLLIVSFFKTSSGLAACCTVSGALIGFLTGIYIPVGSMSDEVQILVKCFPVSHGTSLFRQQFLETVTEQCFKDPEQAQWFMEYMGAELHWNETMITWEASVILLVMTALASAALASLKILRR